MPLKNKRVLITAGPTWVPIDKVRVISNIATGETGVLLAQKLKNLGAKVTLVLGPAQYCCLDKKIKLMRFKFYDELKGLVIRELNSKKYDIVIHSAAVPDYRPLKCCAGKISSGIKKWRLELIPTVKIIDRIKKIDPGLFLVGFKFEAKTTKDILIREAKKLIQQASLDLAVANSIHRNRYLAYLVERDKIYGPLLNKKDLAVELAGLIKEKICKI